MHVSIDKPDILTCLQTDGVDYLGHSIVLPPITASNGTVTVLHLLVNRTVSILEKTSISVNVVVNGGEFETKLSISILPDTTTTTSNNMNFSDVWRLSRLSWLNSKSGVDSSITRPYTPLIVNELNDTFIVKSRGREITFSACSGLPVRVMSNDRSVLENPMTFQIQSLALKCNDTIRPVIQSSSVSWNQTFVSKSNIRAVLNVVVDYDGHFDASFEILSTTTTVVGPASLTMSLPSSVVKYANGGGFSDNGDFFPSSDPSKLNWSWRDFDSTVPDPNAPAGDPVSAAGWRLWLGDVNAGLFLKFKGVESGWNEAAPRSGSVSAPSSWAGENFTSGSINVSLTNNHVVEVMATSGSSLELEQFVPLVFNFTFHITPVKGVRFLFCFCSLTNLSSTHKYYIYMFFYHRTTRTHLRERRNITQS